MSPKTKTVTKWALDSFALADAWTDFILSRQAKLCTPGTIKFYGFTAGRFVQWLESQGITAPDQVSARLVRAYLASLTNSQQTIANNARAIRVLVRFWYAEKYLP